LLLAEASFNLIRSLLAEVFFVDVVPYQATEMVGIPTYYSKSVAALL
jgi:hypothetical protein